MIPQNDAGVRIGSAGVRARRWWRGGSPHHRKPLRRKWLFWGVPAAGLVVTGLTLFVARRLAEAPKVEPPFERIVDDRAGPIREFALKDTSGNWHTMAEWADRTAIVIFFIATECPASNGYAPEMARLAHEYGARDVLFLAIHSDPGSEPETAASHALEYGLEFPILLDPGGTVARQAGVRVTPEAAVVAPDGQVYYRGRIDDRYALDGRRRDAALVHDLENALAAVVTGQSPVVTQTRAFGCPLLLASGRDRGASTESVTFTQHVAPILWKNCSPCHRPGEVAPFSLLSYRDAAKRADFLVDVTSTGRMPPWKPHAGAGVFLDAARLSTTEIETLKRWAETGCKQGEPIADRALHNSPKAGGWARPICCSRCPSRTAFRPADRTFIGPFPSGSRSTTTWPYTDWSSGPAIGGSCTIPESTST